MASLLASAAPQLPLQWAQGAASRQQGPVTSLWVLLLQPYQEEELTHPVSSPYLPLCVPLSLPLPVGCGAARPAGVLEGGPGAKAGEGEGRGAAQGWHGDPRPHPQLCGKVSGRVCSKGEWQRQLSVFVL